MEQKIEELKALLEQEEKNLTVDGKKRIEQLQVELNEQRTAN